MQNMRFLSVLFFCGFFHRLFLISVDAAICLQPTMLSRTHMIQKTLQRLEGKNDSILNYHSVNNYTSTEAKFILNAIQITSVCSSSKYNPNRRFLKLLQKARASYLLLTPSFYSHVLRHLHQERPNKVVPTEAPTQHESVSRSTSPDTTKTTATTQLPLGARWAVAEPSVDLSGVWISMITPDFKTSLDIFLSGCCQQSYLVRKAILYAVSFQRDTIEQSDGGRVLEISSWNPLGTWDRTIVASGNELVKDTSSMNDESFPTDANVPFYDPLYLSMTEPDGGMSIVEAWWEGDGSIHKSWIYGSSKAIEDESGKGNFEVSRYLETSDILVCEVFFRAASETKESLKSSYQSPHLVWKFQREQ